MNLSKDQITEIARSIGVDYASLMAFISVESGGLGFINGRIVIQFEPSWFKKNAPYAPSGQWSVNKVEGQVKEYAAFSEAFHLNKNAAMKSTSWGLGQIMGFHYALLGYKTVDEMVDDFKKGDYQQVMGIAKFIKGTPALLKALRAKNWHLVAVYYNGSGYKALAAKYGREPYDLSMQKAYARYT
ncbi:MAG TPA: N-acetylmuramidase family protein [Pedobacter sp.]|uniref:N-acetylmuramidase family protein n=1 Tax=Pedobacter sp. TaxID=1411316 RepID=UPI002BDE39F1|nr:N-acetylmuramidase family protein [Pedobacter sp.]HMI04263.1 N-acetylmuramidase family protein [Pedobacter sp.]